MDEFLEIVDNEELQRKRKIQKSAGAIEHWTKFGGR
jgi:hypothetical protein